VQSEDDKGEWGYKIKGPSLRPGLSASMDVLDQAADCSSVGPSGNAFYVQTPDGFDFLGIWEAEHDGSQG